MKRKSVLILAVIMSIVCFSGCGADKNKTLELGGLSDDSQAYWNIYNHNVARGETGYYYMLSSFSRTSNKSMTQGSFLYYMDADTGVSTLLCSKPDCSHNDTDCNAWLSVNYGSDQIYYYNGYLYAYKYNDENGLVYLVRISSDGSERKELFEIGKGKEVPYCLAFHDNSVYVHIRQGGVSGYDEITSVIRRRSLDGKEDENIYEKTSIGAQVYGVKCYGNKIFFMVEEQSRASKDSQERLFNRQGLFVYDCGTKKYEQFIDGAVSDYTIDTDNNVIYYYLVNDGLYKRNLSGEGKPEKLYTFEDKQTNICQLSYDGTYLYMSNELYPTFFLEPAKSYELYVCDTDGKILKQIETPGPFTMFFGDSEYLFSMSEVYTKGSLRCMKKSDITSDAEWVILN